MRTRWLLYGATGYTGRLIAEQAKKEGYAPLLGGRTPDRLASLATALHFDHRVFALDQAAEMLHDIGVVLHCAGPFSETSAAMRSACLRAGCHYLDITGELPVFTACHAEDDLARQAGVVFCPGVGFDVIPTDCVAACLGAALPEAVHLQLGFITGSGTSRGTKLSALQVLSHGNVIRKDGRLRRVPYGFGRRTIHIAAADHNVSAVPYGDLATAWYSTGIQNIEVLAPLGRAATVALRVLGPLLRISLIQRVVRRLAVRQASTLDEATRSSRGARVWGEAWDAKGRHYRAELETSNPYNLTVHGALMAVRMLQEYTGPGGYFTPSQLFGDRCVEALPGSSGIRLTRLNFAEPSV